MTYGVVGFVASIVMSLATLFNLYSKVGNSDFSNCTSNCKTDILTWQTIVTHIAIVLTYISVAAIVAGVLMTILVGAKAKKT